MDVWKIITFAGDSVITLPAAAAIVVWLISAGAWRMALGWIALFGSALALVVMTKVAFIGWGIGIAALDFTGLSGHAMRACAVLPVLAWLLFQYQPRPVRNAAVIVSLALALLISASRVVLHYHSPAEAALGGALGILVAAAFVRISERSCALRIRRWVVALTMLGLVPSAYAEPAPTHHWVTELALYLSGNDRPYVRYENGRLARAPLAEQRAQ